MPGPNRREFLGMQVAGLSLRPSLAPPVSPLDAIAAVVPQPARLTPGGGAVLIGPRPQIIAAAGARRAAALLAHWLESDTDVTLPPAPDSTGGVNTIDLRLTTDGARTGPGSSYSLRASPGEISIESATHSGLVHGCQTLRQMLVHRTRGAGTLPLAQLEDWPRFSWRGLMLDCSRTFLSVSYLKRTVELLSYHKLNVLHLHLTDDQGWRIEIPKYPRLTTVGSRFSPRYPDEHGGFYSREELRELIHFAAERGVTIVPEIEMPGHATAALASYPELSCAGGPFEIFPFFRGPNITNDVFCAGNERTFDFLEGVLAEVVDLFPSRYVHIGGDECPTDRWRKCPKCQARMRAEGLKDETELQAYFVRRIVRYLEGRGKVALGWDEIAGPGLPRSAAVMFWRGVGGAGAVAQAGHDVVLSPTSHCYFDYRQSDLPQERAEGATPISLERVYSFEPGIEEVHILGIQANMWTHYARTEDQIDRQLFPRLAALAEVAWTPSGRREWDGFHSRLRAHCRRLAEMGVRLGINFDPDPAAWADPALGRSKR